jgi:hypothetical protein
VRALRPIRAQTDELLAQRAAKGDAEAFAELAYRYRRMIAHTTRVRVRGLERSDQWQEALLGLWEACQADDRSRGNEFGALATTCIRRRVWNARARARTGKHRVLSEAVGLDHRVGDGEHAATLAERLPAPDAYDPAVVVELRDELRRLATIDPAELRKAERRPFTDAEKQHALTMVASGKSRREAAAAVGAGYSTLTAWLQKAA